jgi:hypothetical protein
MRNQPHKPFGHPYVLRETLLNCPAFLNRGFETFCRLSWSACVRRWAGRVQRPSLPLHTHPPTTPSPSPANAQPPDHPPYTPLEIPPTAEIMQARKTYDVAKSNYGTSCSLNASQGPQPTATFRDFPENCQGDPRICKGSKQGSCNGPYKSLQANP